MLKLVGRITNMRYQSFLKSPLSVVSFDSEVNAWPSKCYVKDEQLVYAVSKWTGPKRTRTYPLANVYDTLAACGGKTVAIIPLVKDEGADSQNMDYLQWDTLQLMSLLNVYVILAYYRDAQPNRRDAHKPNRITKQQFDSASIKTKIKELSNYYSSALHWNLEQLNPENLEHLMQNIIHSYRIISKKTGVKLHNEKGLETFRQQITTSRENFLAFSRQKAVQAQIREVKTVQPKEMLGEGVKTPIEIENYLGGKYFLTVDDVIIRDETYELIESKHSRKSILPGEHDIKDGLIKMLLFSNIDELYQEADDNSRRTVKFLPILRLTSEKIQGEMSTTMDAQDLNMFFQRNHLRKSKEDLVNKLLQEATVNKFNIRIEHRTGDVA